MLSGGGSQSRAVRDQQEPHVGLQDVGGGPGVSGVWRWGCSYRTQGSRQNKASSDTQGDKPSRVPGLRGFPGRGAFGAKAGKVLGNQYASVTPPVIGHSTGDSS